MIIFPPILRMLHKSISHKIWILWNHYILHLQHPYSVDTSYYWSRARTVRSQTDLSVCIIFPNYQPVALWYQDLLQSKWLCLGCPWADNLWAGSDNQSSEVATLLCPYEPSSNMLQANKPRIHCSAGIWELSTILLFHPSSWQLYGQSVHFHTLFSLCLIQVKQKPIENQIWKHPVPLLQLASTWKCR